MWISWINTERLLGDFAGTVKRAVEANVGQVVYFRILEVLTEEENWTVAIEFGKKMLKKFNRDLSNCYSLAIASLFNLLFKC